MSAAMQYMTMEEAAAHLSVMKRQEGRSFVCADYLNMAAFQSQALHESLGGASSSASCRVDEECRFKMCQWFYQVIDYFKFSRETVHIAMSYLDRFLCTAEGSTHLNDRPSYQLIAITSLYIAIKMNEPVKLDLSLLVELSRKSYTAEKIAEMESKILDALEWRMHLPTPLAFVQYMMSFIPSNIDSSTKQSIMEGARHQTELAVFDYSLVATSASTVAINAIITAMEASTHCQFHYFCKVAFLEGLPSFMARNSCIEVQNATYRSQFGGNGLTDLRKPKSTGVRSFPLQRRDVCALSPVCVASR